MSTIDADDIRPAASQMIQILHSQAHAFMLAYPDLTPADAIRKVAALAVRVYDRLLLEGILRDAAETEGVDSTLAALVAPGGGATLALSRDTSVDAD